ncbi:Esterase [Glycine max]|nr:Esterase [Glycine max]
MPLVTSRSNKGSFVSNTTEFLSIAKFHVSLVMLLSVATIILNPAFATEYCDFPVIFKFGDSNSDTGGLVASLLPLTASYGDTYFHRPEGRFSDGRLTIDFMGNIFNSSYLSNVLDWTFLLRTLTDAARDLDSLQDNSLLQLYNNILTFHN